MFEIKLQAATIEEMRSKAAAFFGLEVPENQNKSFAVHINANDELEEKPAKIAKASEKAVKAAKAPKSEEKPAKVADAPAATAAQEQKAYSKSDVIAQLSAVIAKIGPEQVKNLMLESTGKTKISEVEPGQYPLLVSACEIILSKLPA